MATDELRLTVFEIVNERRREIYVGTTEKPIFEVIAEIRRRRPEAISHWDLEDATTVRSVEFGLSRSEARAFVERYRRSALPRGWRFLD